MTSSSYTCYHCGYVAKNVVDWVEHLQTIAHMEAYQQKVNQTSLPETINHPAHYIFGKYEVIDVIEDWQLSYHLGNAVKYIARAGKKDKSKLIEDINKAIWYLNRFVEKNKQQTD